MTTAQLKTSVTPIELQRLMQDCPVELVDVRTPSEFATAHVPGATLVTLDSLDATRFLSGREDKNQPIYILCQTGARALRAIEKFRRAGFQDCVLVEGGTQAWLDAGLPVIRSAGKTLSLIRQVQLTVGIVSAAGALLALTVSRLFALVPLLTGCGLMFAGLTGTCGLALLLARMPWNRHGPGDANSCCDKGN